MSHHGHLRPTRQQSSIIINYAETHFGLQHQGEQQAVQADNEMKTGSDNPIWSNH
jgi:hypothetical protein